MPHTPVCWSVCLSRNVSVCSSGSLTPPGWGQVRAVREPTDWVEINPHPPPPQPVQAQHLPPPPFQTAMCLLDPPLPLSCQSFISFFCSFPYFHISFLPSFLSFICFLISVFHSNRSFPLYSHFPIYHSFNKLSYTYILYHSFLSSQFSSLLFLFPLFRFFFYYFIFKYIPSYTVQYITARLEYLSIVLSSLYVLHCNFKFP
jgi:hypothetical protein